VGVLTHVGIVHCAELVGVFALVLCDVCLVNPSEGLHEPGTISRLSLSLDGVESSHVVQRRTDVSHETHEEEGQLQHRMLEELETFHNIIVPS
jgi:hypothetical protein